MRGAAAGGAAGEAERPAGPPPAGAPEAGPSRPHAVRGGVSRPVSLVWLRRDLRLDDNPALTAALKTGGNVVRMRRGVRCCAQRCRQRSTGA
jgi:hypothetical protein